MKSKQRIILIAIVMTLFCSMFVFPASAVDLNETESNNTAATADVTYDDYNNYGKISTTSDVDWWEITFSQNGSANFWLGNFPSGCCYMLFLYELNDSNLIAKSFAGTSSQLINARVYAGVTYKIKITSLTGSSSTASYLFRAKNYTTTRKAKVYTFTDTSNRNIPFIQNFSNISSYLTYMDYSHTHRFDYIAATAFAEIPDCSLVAIYNHAEAGRIAFANNTYMFGSRVVYNSQNGALGQYEYNALSNVKLISFVGCHSGVPDPLWGNLVDGAIGKGAMCSIGWIDEPIHQDVLKWNQKFYEALSYGDTIAYAIEEAYMYLAEGALDFDAITSTYIGSSPTESLTLY